MPALAGSGLDVFVGPHGAYAQRAATGARARPVVDPEWEALSLHDCPDAAADGGADAAAGGDADAAALGAVRERYAARVGALVGALRAAVATPGARVVFVVQDQCGGATATAGPVLAAALGRAPDFGAGPAVLERLRRAIARAWPGLDFEIARLEAFAACCADDP